MEQGYLKIGDTQPSLTGQLFAGKEPLNLNGASVQLFVKDRVSDEVVVDGRAVEVTEPTEGRIESDWIPSDTEKERDLLAEFVATYEDGEITVPNRGFLPVKISEDIKSKTED